MRKPIYLRQPPRSATRAKAYALASAVQLSPLIGLHSADTFDALSNEALAMACSLNDPYLQFLVRHAIVQNEAFSGRMSNATKAAEELVEVGRRMNDPDRWDMELL